MNKERGPGQDSTRSIIYVEPGAGQLWKRMETHNRQGGKDRGGKERGKEETGNKVPELTE